MSYNKLILKTNAAIEIENTIAHYTLIDIVLAKRIENETPLKIVLDTHGFNYGCSI